jgi:hypothetical protein
MLSHAEDSVVESCWRRRYRGDLVAARYRCRVMLVTVMPSHVDDGVVDATWLWRDVDMESSW